MKIIIVGNGKVGYAIARQLAVEDHDITIVDDDAAALHRADSTLDVMCVEGNGASISVLDTAGVRSADLVIAVTNLDETNLGAASSPNRWGPITPSPGYATPSIAGMTPCSSGRSAWTCSSTPIWGRPRRSPGF